MAPRTELQTALETLLGSENVYFQPPPSVQMQYPCIVYGLSDMDTKYADNNPYRVEKRYSITVIDANPDSLIPDRVALLKSAIFERSFKADSLNHTIFGIYF